MNIRKTILYSLFFTTLVTHHLFGQNCNCPEQFDFLTKKIEINYAGYLNKVNPETQADFDEHTAKYRKLTEGANADTTCFRLLDEWAEWFKDHHIQLRNNLPESSPEEIRARFADWETIPVTEAEARLIADRAGSDPVEGIWRDEAGNYKLAVLKKANDRRDYVGVVLEADSVWWMPGQVKFELKSLDEPGTFNMTYYMRDHSERTPLATLENHVLKMEGLGSWVKLYPEKGMLPKSEPGQIYRLEQLDEQTLLLVVPTMNHNYRKELKKLVKKNKKLLKSTPNLIIDLRDNGGGSDITYRPLEPYVYTQPVTFDRMKTRATKDNADKYFRLSKDKNMPWLNRKYYKKYAKELLEKQGQFVGKDGKGTFKKRKPLENPKKVALLINGGCGSSCEQFVLYAMQGKKVTLMGEPTGGVLDYGNLHTLTFPCEYFQVAYPTSRSNRVARGEGIDNVGIAPEVEVGEEVKDWVEFAKLYLLRE